MTQPDHRAYRESLNRILLFNAAHGCVAGVRAALDFGADVNYVNRTYHPPLDQAMLDRTLRFNAFHNCVSGVKVALAKGADVNSTATYV